MVQIDSKTIPGSASDTQIRILDIGCDNMKKKTVQIG